jgi:hypothetical protein
MIREADREDQIAAARTLPRNVSLQLPDAPLVKPSETAAQNTTPANLPPPAGTYAFKPLPAAPQAKTTTTAATAENNKPAVTPAVTPGVTEELPSFVPAPKSLISDQAAANVATVNTGSAGNVNAVLTSLAKPSETSLETRPAPVGGRVAQLSLLPSADVLKVGEKRRYAVQLSSDVSLSLALLALRFDPKVVRVTALSAGSLLPSGGDTAPLFTPLIDPAAGTCMISISSLNGKASFKGSGPLLFIDVEAIGHGNASLTFVKDTLHLVATDSRDIASEIIQGTATVKQ